MSNQQSRHERAETILAINTPGTKGMAERARLRAVEAVLEKLEQAEHERDTLAEAIREAAVKSGICRPDAALTGPHLVMLASDMADRIKQQDDELHQVLVDVRTMAGMLRGREWAEHGYTHQDTQDLEAAISGMVGRVGGAQAAFEQAAALVVKMTAPPRDLMGAPTVAMKTTANLGQRIAAAIRALKPESEAPQAVPGLLKLPKLPPLGIDVFRIEGYKAAQMEQYARDAVALNMPAPPVAQHAEAPQAELRALHDELNRITWEGEDEGWNLAITAVQKRICEILAVPATKAKSAQADERQEGGGA